MNDASTQRVWLEVIGEVVHVPLDGSGVGAGGGEAVVAGPLRKERLMQLVRPCLRSIARAVYIVHSLHTR